MKFGYVAVDKCDAAAKLDKENAWCNQLGTRRMDLIFNLCPEPVKLLLLV